MVTSDAWIYTRWAGYLALAVVIIGNAAGNLLLKIGADITNPRQLLFGLFPWQTVAGIACFALGILAYSWALRNFELHAAQIIVSLQYVAVIALAALVLGEQIDIQKWGGIALIALGLYVCSRP